MDLNKYSIFRIKWPHNCLTQKQLSKLSGIDQANISKIENGEYNPSFKLLKKFAHAMNCRLEIKFVPIEDKWYWIFIIFKIEYMYHVDKKSNISNLSESSCLVKKN